MNRSLERWTGAVESTWVSMMSSSGVTLAARLMTKAEPGAALVSSSVYKQTRGSICSSLRTPRGTPVMRLKGISKPQFVFKPVAHTGDLEVTDGANAGAAPRIRIEMKADSAR